MKKSLLASIISAVILVGCSENHDTPKATAISKNDSLFVYTNNRSHEDSLAVAKVIVDDSLLFEKPIPFSTISSSQLAKVTTVAKGSHRFKVIFGKFTVDTTFVVNGNTSILASMHYNAKYPDGNGLAVISIIRDGSGGRD